jgi:hypothetical protein
VVRGGILHRTSEGTRTYLINDWNVERVPHLAPGLGAKLII